MIQVEDDDDYGNGEKSVSYRAPQEVTSVGLGRWIRCEGGRNLEN